MGEQKKRGDKNCIHSRRNQTYIKSWCLGMNDTVDLGQSGQREEAHTQNGKTGLLPGRAQSLALRRHSMKRDQKKGNSRKHLNLSNTASSYIKWGKALFTAAILESIKIRLCLVTLYELQRAMWFKEMSFYMGLQIFLIERISCNCFWEGKVLDGGFNSPGFESHFRASCCCSVSFISNCFQTGSLATEPL